MSKTIVGRDRALSVLSEAVERAGDGRGTFVLIAGEAGIGKTTVLTAAALDATAKGAFVAAGTCWDGAGVPGFWPWIQIVRALKSGIDPAEWAQCRQAAGRGLDRLLGEVGDTTATDDAAFHLFDAATTLLVSAARNRRLMVVVDDLHWADPPSLRLLDFVVRHTSLEHIVVAAAFRDDEIAGDHPLRPLMARLIGEAEIVPLAGLDHAAVATLITGSGVSDATAETVADIHRRTGGNPLFVEQVVRLWTATGSLGGVGPGVRYTIERRLARLPSACVDLLTTAALVGTEFDVPLAAAASERAPREIAPAMTARLVSAVGDSGARFVHDLVRETLCASLDAADERRRHAAIVRAAEAARPEGTTLLPAQLAHHARAAVPDVPPPTALRLLLAAGEDASARLANDEACGHYRAALDLADSQARPAVALRLGEHQHRAGEPDAARLTYAGILSSARTSGDVESFALAALGLHALGQSLEHGANADIALLDEAQARLGADGRGGDALLARVMAAASQVRTHQLGEDRDAGERRSAAAVDLARASGDRDALGSCLLAHHDAIWQPGTARLRLELADEMAAVARAGGNRELELQASLLRMVALLETGDPRGLDEHRRFTDLAGETRLPRYRYLAASRKGAMALLAGHFAAARRHMDDALELGGEIGIVDRFSVWYDQAWALARLLGRHDEIDEMIAMRRATGDAALVVVEAVQALDGGNVDVALAHLDELEALGRRWPRWAALMWLTFRAQLAAVSGDAERCAAVRAAIGPFRDHWAVLGGAVLVHGPMSYWAAIVDLAEHWWDAAIDGFAAAERSADRLGARPWSVLARLGRAQSLFGRDGTGDSTLAHTLLAAVNDEAAALGMSDAVALLQQSRDVPSPDANVFRPDGDVWRLAFAGRTIVMPDAKGLHDLRALLTRPRTDIAAVALLNPHGGELVLAAQRVGADAVLDERAKTEYRARLAALEAAIDAALDRRDDARAARFEAERAALIDELRRASALGGRSRRLGDESERARKTVTARIRDALRRIDRRHPPLAEHLRASVATGTVCRYDPAGDITWVL